MKHTTLATVIVSVFVLASTIAVHAEDKGSATPTFNKDVAPILFESCATCHRPGEAAPFSLLTYQDAKKHGDLIAQLTKSRQMPPWKAEKGDVAFKNERRLNEEQVAILQAWLKAGMPEGKKEDLPAEPKFESEWALGKPDLIVKMPKAYHVPAEGRDIYRNFAVSLGLTEDKWVRAVDFRSSTSVVHHSLFFLDTSGTAAKKEADSGEVGSRGAMGGLGRRGAGGGGGGRG
jgi:mono/diheme cytochrome c family protein